MCSNYFQELYEGKTRSLQKVINNLYMYIITSKNLQCWNKRSEKLSREEAEPHRPTLKSRLPLHKICRAASTKAG